MTSIGARTRQVSADTGYYINVGDLRGAIFSITGNSGNATVSTATWSLQSSAISSVQSTLGVAGAALLKDMGKTVVSASRTFRKVQLVVSTTSTFGVGGASGSTFPQADYYTGYVELGFEGYGAPSKVAAFGR